MSVDIGTISGKVAFDLDTSALLDAIGKLADVATALTKTGERSKDSGATVETAYRKLAAALDPVVAGQQRYERAQQTLEAALAKGVITQEQYTAALARAQEKFTSTEQNANSLRAKLDELAHSVDEFGGHLSELGEKFESVKSFGEGLKEKLLELAAVVGVGLSLDKVIEDTVASQDAQAQLAAGLKATGAVTGETKEKLEALTTALAGTTKYSRTTIEQAESLGLTFTHISANDFPRFLQGAADIAARMGTDLPSAVEKLGRALDTGVVSGLKRAGITFDQTQIAQAKFFASTGQYSKEIALVLGTVESRLVGSAEAARNTLGGAFQLLRNEFEEVAISIGTQLSPALTTLTKEIEDLAKSDQFKILAADIGSFLVSAISALGTALQFLATHLEAVKEITTALLLVRLAFWLKEVAEAEVLVGIASIDLGEAFTTFKILGFVEGLQYLKILLLDATVALRAFVAEALVAAAPFLALGIAVAGVAYAIRQYTIEQQAGSEAMLKQLGLLGQARAAFTEAGEAIESVTRWQEELDKAREAGDPARIATAERNLGEAHRLVTQELKDRIQATGSALVAELALAQADLDHAKQIAGQKVFYPAGPERDTAIARNPEVQDATGRAKDLEQQITKLGDRLIALSKIPVFTEPQKADVTHFAEHFNSAAQAVQAYADKIFDLTNKLQDNGANQSKLLTALSGGEIEYNLQKAAIERTNAIESTTIEVTKAHRGELEKLRSEIDKASAAISAKHGVDQAATTAIREGSDALAKAEKNYKSTVASLSELAAKNVDLTQSEKVRLLGLQDTRAFNNAYDGELLKLQDALTGTSAATRDHATALDVERTLLVYSTKGIADLDGSIAENVRQRHAQLNALTDVIAAQKSLTGLSQKTQVDVAISNLDSTATNELRSLGEKYISFVTTLGHGSLDEGDRLLHAWADHAGVDFKAVTDSIKANLQQIADAALAKKITASGESLLTAYQQERADIERLMAASSDRVHVTVAAGLKSLEELQRRYFDTQLSAYSSALGILSQEFGGVFTQLLRFVQILQEIQTLRADVSTIISGITSTFSGTASDTGLVTASASLDGSATALTTAAASLEVPAGSLDGSAILLDSAAEALVYAGGFLTSAVADWAGVLTLSSSEAEASWAAIQSSAAALDGSAAALDAAAGSLEASAASSGASSAAGGAGGGAAAGGFAGGAAVIAAFVVAYLAGSQILNIRERHAFGSPGSYQIVNGQGIESGETAIADAIRKVVKDFETLAGVTITSLDSIGIKVQNSGKEFRAYVGDTLIGTFGSLQEAVGVALQRAFSTAKLSGAIAPAVQELLTGSLANNSIDLTQFTASLKLVTDGLNQNVPQITINLRKLNTDFAASLAAQVELFRTHASVGLSELFGQDLQKWRDSIDSLRDSITGQQHSAFILFEQQRQAFNAENDAHRASLLAQIADTKAKLLAAGVTIAAIAQIMGAVNAAQSGLRSLSASLNYGTQGQNTGDTPTGSRNYGNGDGPTGPQGQVGVNPRGGGGPTGNAVQPVIPGIKEFNTDDLKALLAELVKELGALPDNIKSSEFSGNKNSTEYFANQLASTDSDFGKLVADLVKSGQSADAFGSTLKADLANLTLALEDQRRAITGDTLSAKEQLEIRKRQAIAWNAQLALDQAALQLQILKQQADIAAAIASRALAQAAIDNAKAMGNAAAILAATTAAASGITDAQLAAMLQNLAALQGVLDALKNEKPIDPNTLKPSGGGKGSGSGSGQTPAQQLAAFFAAFQTSQLPQLAQQIEAVNAKYDAEIKLVKHNSAAIAQLNADREIETQKLKDAARATAIGSVNSFLGVNGPQLVAQIVGVNKSADDLIAGLRELAKEGALSTAQLHSLVPAIRAAAAAQVEAIKQTVFASIDAFSGVLRNTGLTAALAGIDAQAKALRTSLNELAAAGVLSADQFNRSAAEIIAAANAQKQAAITNAADSLLNQLYGYLKDTADAAQLKYTLTIAELEVQRNQLALAGYAAAGLAIIDGLIAKVVAGGPGQFDTNPAATGPNPANALAAAAAQQSAAGNSLQSAAAAFAAAIQGLTAYEQSLYTNSTLSALTPAQQLAAARSQLQADYSAALGGDTSAVTSFQNLANTFLQLAHAQDPTRSSYSVDFQQVIDELDNLRSLTGIVAIPGAGNTSTSGLPGTATTPLSTVTSQAFLNLDPVVSSINSASARNHEDLTGVQTQLLTLTSVVRTQQASLDRVVSFLGHP